MTKLRVDPDPEWIIPERAYAPGYEPRPRVPDPSHSSASPIPWDDLWRGAALLVLAFGAMGLIATLVR